MSLGVIGSNTAAFLGPVPANIGEALLPLITIIEQPLAGFIIPGSSLINDYLVPWNRISPAVLGVTTPPVESVAVGTIIISQTLPSTFLTYIAQDPVVTLSIVTANVVASGSTTFTLGTLKPNIDPGALIQVFVPSAVQVVIPNSDLLQIGVF
jgi:hypothetical protein